MLSSSGPKMLLSASDAVQGHAAGDVGHAVMDHAVLLVHRVGVGGHLAGLEGAAAVDAHVHDHRAGLHLAHHLLGHHHRCAAMLGAQGTDGDIGTLQGGLDLVGLHHRGVEPLAQVVLQAAQAVDAGVEHLHAGAQAQCGAGGELAHGTGTDHHHLGGATPEMPPSIRPGPPFSELSCSEAYQDGGVPAIRPWPG